MKFTYKTLSRRRRHKSEDVDLYSKYGIGGKEIAKYQAAGVYEGKDIEKLHLEGVTGDRALEAKTAGLNPFVLPAFEEIGVATIAGIQKFESNGICGWDAIHYHLGGFTTLDEMTELKAAGVDGREARDYSGAGATTVSAAIDLFQGGVASIDAVVFQKCGITSTAEMKAYTKAGLRGIHARGFTDYGITDIDEIERHIGSGISPLEMIRYLPGKGRRHNFTFEEVITLISGGIRSDRAEEYIAAGVADPEHIVNIERVSKTNGVTTDELPELFETLNELGELGAKIAANHPAAKTTVDATKQTPELADELNALNNEQLKVVITLIEEHEHITAEELRATIKAVTL